MLLGHSIGLNKAYYRPGDDEILREYAKAIDLLTINDENRLKLQLQDEKSKQDAITDMQLQQNAMKEMMVKLVESLASSNSQPEINALSKSLAAAGILKPKEKEKSK